MESNQGNVLTEQIKTLSTKESDIEKELAAEKDFALLIGREGFLGSIFDEIISEISFETNQILAKIPNTSHITFNLHSESTTQKGVIKKNIVPVVTINGFEAPLSSGCSGGMQAAIELAVDMAVNSVISKRTGIIPGWIILDEVFEGLGPVEKEGCLEILSKEKLVIIIDHSSETKQMFDKKIEIVYKNGISTSKDE